jgi:hypothetical protein
MKRIGSAPVYTTTDHNIASMAPNVAYIANSASLLTFTLPTTARKGDTFTVVGSSTGGWEINANMGQSILYRTESSSQVRSGAPYSAITIICTTDNTDFVAAEYGASGGGGASVESADLFATMKQKGLIFDRSPNNTTMIEDFTRTQGLSLKLAKQYQISDGTTIYLHENATTIDDMNATTGWTAGTNTPTLAAETGPQQQSFACVSMEVAALNGSMSMYKTFTAFSLFKKSLKMWVQLSTNTNVAGTPIKIYLESSPGNHRLYTFQLSRFPASQWALIECDGDSPGFSESGTPDMNNITKITVEATTSAAQTLKVLVDYIVTTTNQDLINSRYSGTALYAYNQTNQELIKLVAEDATEKGKYTLAAPLLNNYIIGTDMDNFVAKDYGLNMSYGFGAFESATGAHAKTQWIGNRQLFSKPQRGKNLQVKANVVADNFTAYDTPSANSLRINGSHTARFKAGDSVIIWFNESESLAWSENNYAQYNPTWESNYKILTLSADSAISVGFTLLPFVEAHGLTDVKNLYLMRIPVKAQGFVGGSLDAENLIDLDLVDFIPSAKQDIFFDNFNRANSSQSITGNWTSTIHYVAAYDSGYDWGIFSNYFHSALGNGRQIDLGIYPTVNKTIDSKYFEVTSRMYLTNSQVTNNHRLHFGWGFNSPNIYTSTGYLVNFNQNNITSGISVRLDVSGGSNLVSVNALPGYNGSGYFKIKIKVEDTRVLVKVWLESQAEPASWDINYNGISWNTGKYWGLRHAAYADPGPGLDARIDDFLLSSPDQNGAAFVFEDTGLTGEKMAVAVALDRQDTTNDNPTVTKIIGVLV